MESYGARLTLYTIKYNIHYIILYYFIIYCIYIYHIPYVCTYLTVSRARMIYARHYTQYEVIHRWSNIRGRAIVCLWWPLMLPTAGGALCLDTEYIFTRVWPPTVSGQSPCHYLYTTYYILPTVLNLASPRPTVNLFHATYYSRVTAINHSKWVRLITSLRTVRDSFSGRD